MHQGAVAQEVGHCGEGAWLGIGFLPCGGLVFGEFVQEACSPVFDGALFEEDLAEGLHDGVGSGGMRVLVRVLLRVRVRAGVEECFGGFAAGVVE